MENNILILDQQRIAKKLQRMAYQVWEHNSKETSIILLGVEGPGLVLARELAKRIEQISSIKTEVHSIRVDKKKPLQAPAELTENLTGKSVVLVDDVANSGRTLLYAMKPLLAFEPKKVLVAVLVDRTHKSFPVYPDIVGHSVATTLQEHIEVVCEGETITAAYLH